MTVITNKQIKRKLHGLRDGVHVRWVVEELRFAYWGNKCGLSEVVVPSDEAHSMEMDVAARVQKILAKLASGYGQSYVIVEQPIHPYAQTHGHHSTYQLTNSGHRLANCNSSS